MNIEDFNPLADKSWLEEAKDIQKGIDESGFTNSSLFEYKDGYYDGICEFMWRTIEELIANGVSKDVIDKINNLKVRNE